MKVVSLVLSGFTSWCSETDLSEIFEDKVVVISGRSGSGKSSIFDAICFALYGKPTKKVSKSGLANKKSKGEKFVKLKFLHNGSEVSVSRWINSSKFELSVDGQKIDAGHDNKSLQEYLENEIIGLSYNQFVNMTMLSNSTGSNFFLLGVAERRKFVDSLFGLENLEQIRKFLVCKKNRTNDDISVIIGKIATIDEQLSRHGLVEVDVEETKNKIGDIDDKISFINDKVEELDKLKNAVLAKIHDLRHKLSRAQSAIEKFSNGVCPTCGQDVHDKIDISKLKEKVELIVEKLKELEDKKESVDKKIFGLRSERMDLEEKLRKLKVDLQVAQQRKEDADELKARKKALEDEKKKLAIKMKIFDTAAKVLSDDGVKRDYYDSIFHVFCSVTSDIMADFGLNHSIEYDGKDFVFSRLGQKYKVWSLSDGERARVGLASALAWFELANKFSGMRFDTVFLDEITTNLDSHTVEMLKTHLLGREENFVIISHSPQLMEMTDRLVVVHNDNGCSRFQIEG